MLTSVVSNRTFVLPDSVKIHKDHSCVFVIPATLLNQAEWVVLTPMNVKRDSITVPSMPNVPIQRDLSDVAAILDSLVMESTVLMWMNVPANQMSAMMRQSAPTHLGPIGVSVNLVL